MSAGKRGILPVVSLGDESTVTSIFLEEPRRRCGWCHAYVRLPDRECAFHACRQRCVHRVLEEATGEAEDATKAEARAICGWGWR